MLRTNGQGITISNLFDGWPLADLGQIFFTDAEPNSDFCINNHRLSGAAFALDHLLRKHGTRLRTNHPLTNKISAVGPVSGSRLAFCVRLHLAMRALSDVGPVRLPADTVAWISRFKPEVIYTCLGNARLIRLALLSSGAAGDIPIVPHFMDDWPSTLYADGRVLGVPRRLTLGCLRRLFASAPMGFCIGTDMAAEYHSRYALEFHPFMNCVDDADFANTTFRQAPRPLIWSYVGGLHLNRWKSLLMIARSISARNETLNVFAPSSDVRQHSSLFSGLRNSHLRSLPPERVMDPMKQSDVLVHVESFDPAECAFTRLSVSTKLAQYLSSGKVLLGVGPAELASTKLIRDAGAGLVVSQESQAAVDSGVSRIAQDATFRSSCGQRALQFAFAHFRKGQVCKRFREKLTEAAWQVRSRRQDAAQ